MTFSLPAYVPTRWELRLPDYPIITNSWRSSAFPEILGSLPNGAEWRLEFDNRTNAEALALLLPWRATGGGQWPLDFMPFELAFGCDSADFRKRLTGTTWSIASEPRKESVKNGRFNVKIDLVYELTFVSTYGPTRPIAPVAPSSGLRLGVQPAIFGLSSANIVFFLDPGDNIDSIVILSPSLDFGGPSNVELSLGQNGNFLLEFDEGSVSLASDSLELPIPAIELL
jgi:hypothetical protein